MKFTRKISDALTDLVGDIKKNQVAKPLPDIRDGLVKVNLGCGLRVSSGWLNIDGSLNALIAKWPSWVHKVFYDLSGAKNYYEFAAYSNILQSNRFLFHNLSLGLPLNQESVDYIYSSHFFEHIFREDARRLLKQCRLALKSGGCLRISVPDLSYAVSLYSKGRAEEMLNEFFFVSGQGSYLARHKYMYDFELLKFELEQAGFDEIRRCSFQCGQTPNLNELDNYPEISLYVEARKH